MSQDSSLSTNKRENLRRAALDYHELPTPGKLSVTATKQITNQRDLALAYSPGVAAACEEIVADPINAFRYTARGNLVGVITYGTAVLGLGSIAKAATVSVTSGDMPIMTTGSAETFTGNLTLTGGLTVRVGSFEYLVVGGGGGGGGGGNSFGVYTSNASVDVGGTNDFSGGAVGPRGEGGDAPQAAGVNGDGKPGQAGRTEGVATCATANACGE